MNAMLCKSVIARRRFKRSVTVGKLLHVGSVDTEPSYECQGVEAVYLNDR